MYFSVKIISRGGGKSALASAAYQAGETLSVLEAAAYRAGAKLQAVYKDGEKLESTKQRLTFDYTKKEDVQHTEILAPANAPDWVHSRARLWCEVEAVEKRKDSQLARDIIAALPRELNPEQQLTLLRAFVQENFVSQGMVVDFAIHDKIASDGLHNPHAHIMLSLRDITIDGFGKKNRAWNSQDLVGAWRKRWQEMSNAALDEAGSDYRVSTASYASRGIEKLAGEHLGPRAAGLERKGVETEKGDRNREVKQQNAVSGFRKQYAQNIEREAEEPVVNHMPADQRLQRLALTIDQGSTASAKSASMSEASVLTAMSQEEPAFYRLQQRNRYFLAQLRSQSARVTVKLLRQVLTYAERLAEWLSDLVQGGQGNTTVDRNSVALANMEQQGKSRGYDR